MTEPTSFPLCWPDGWKRIDARDRKAGSQFKTGGSRVGIAAASDRVYDELEKFDAIDVVISTNIKPTIGGRPRADQSAPEDPGVAVYWKARNRPQCMAIDRYETVAANLAAIAATLDAMRAIERHGGAEILDRAFTGFNQLPPPSSEAWWNVLNVSRDATEATIREAARKLLAKHHPSGPQPNESLFYRAGRAKYEALQAKS